MRPYLGPVVRQVVESDKVIHGKPVVIAREGLEVGRSPGGILRCILWPGGALQWILEEKLDACTSPRDRATLLLEFVAMKLNGTKVPPIREVE
jgi:hypothetical protein